MILGIDIDTRKLTLCAYSEDAVTWATGELRTGRAGQQYLDAAMGTILALAEALETLDPTRLLDEAYIERGWGANRVADFQLGVVFGATAIALRRMRPNLHVGVMTTHEWKRSVTAAIGVTTKRGQPGNANAPKEQANSACKIILMEAGEPADRVNALTPDQLDAYGIAWTAWQRNRDEDELEGEHARLRSTHGP